MCVCVCVHMERGSSAVECRTRNQVSPGSNPPPPPRRSRVGVGMNRSAREGKSVKRFERSNGPDIALYKNYLFLPLHTCPCAHVHGMKRICSYNYSFVGATNALKYYRQNYFSSWQILRAKEM